jgi:6-phosphogluconolactonase
VRPELRITDRLAEEAAQLLTDAANRGGHIVLTGGSTPKTAYERAAAMGADWSGAELWFSDERCVPADDEHSNFRMAYDSLISRIRAGDVHRMHGELGPEQGADEYEAEMAAVFGEGVIPHYDLILLGLGPDAHCASLFPGNAELGERRRPVTGVKRPGMAPLVPRITLTLPTLNAGARVVFLVAGEEKAEAVARAFAGAPTPEAPASLLEPEGEYLVLCDPAAAHGAR